MLTTYSALRKGLRWRVQPANSGERGIFRVARTGAWPQPCCLPRSLLWLALPLLLSLLASNWKEGVHATPQLTARLDKGPRRRLINFYPATLHNFRKCASSSLPIHTMLLQKYYPALLAFPIFAGAPLCGASRNIRFDPQKYSTESVPSHKQHVLELEKRQGPLDTTAIQSPTRVVSSVTPVRNVDPIIAVGDWIKYFRGRS